MEEKFYKMDNEKVNSSSKVPDEQSKMVLDNEEDLNAWIDDRIDQFLKSPEYLDILKSAQKNPSAKRPFFPSSDNTP